MNLNLLALGCLCLASLAGCQSTPLGGLAWSPFARQERTTYRTPNLRMEEVAALGRQATGEETPEQRKLVTELATRIQIEPDPLVREAIIQAVTPYRTPLAQQVLEAALSDDDPMVRQRACRSLGQRGDSSSVSSLARVIREDEEFDVRIAATYAMGGIRSPETAPALLAALEDRDPALQFAGVEAMRGVMGQDFGGDVKSYIALAKGETPATAPDRGTAVAKRLRSLSPF